MSKMKTIHQVKKRKLNPAVNQHRKRKLILQKLKMRMVMLINYFLWQRKKLIPIISEQNDESDAKKKATTNRKGKGPASSKKQVAASNETEETPVNDEPKLSEDDEPVDEKSKTTTGRKAATKRTVPASGKKTAATSAKKKGQTDERFDDRTNADVENAEDALLEPSAAKQTKKGRTADKAPASASKPAAAATVRSGKKTKAT